MSTSLLYHAWGLRGYRHQRTEYLGGHIVFEIEANKELLRCATCGSRRVKRKGGIHRLFRSVPIGRKKTWLYGIVPRVECERCENVRQIKVGFAEERVRHTRAFGRYALELSRHMTIQDVAKHLGVSWDVVKEIQREYLQRRFSRPSLGKLRLIAIDEISIGHGHRYLTVVLDLESGAVVFVGDGKGIEALEPFWRRLRRFRRKIQAVATDMSPAYIEAVRNHLPKAKLVFDRFHIVKLFNDKLSDFRRELYHEANGDRRKRVLKGTRWLLLKNPENLEPRRDERKRLKEALRLNEPLATAYYMKEDLRQLWDQKTKRRGGKFLTDWCRRAVVSRIPMLMTLARTFRRHRKGILAWYDYPISTGPLEGTNNKIKTMQRQAYGFRDPEFFKLKILALHETRYALVG